MHNKWNNSLIFAADKRIVPIVLRKVLIVLGLLVSVWTMAQRQIRIIDVETHEPVVRASVEPDGHPFILTDSQGYAIVPEAFDSLTVRHLKYEKERLGFNEVKDTIYLFATEHMLDEVVVVSPKTMMDQLRKELKNKPLPNPAAAPISINIDKLLAFFGYKSKKQRKKEKVAKIIKELGDDIEKEEEE